MSIKKEEKRMKIENKKKAQKQVDLSGRNVCLCASDPIRGVIRVLHWALKMSGERVIVYGRVHGKVLIFIDCSSRGS